MREITRLFSLSFTRALARKGYKKRKLSNSLRLPEYNVQKTNTQRERNEQTLFAFSRQEKYYKTALRRSGPSRERASRQRPRRWRARPRSTVRGSYNNVTIKCCFKAPFEVKSEKEERERENKKMKEK